VIAAFRQRAPAAGANRSDGLVSLVLSPHEVNEWLRRRSSVWFRKSAVITAARIVAAQ